MTALEQFDEIVVWFNLHLTTLFFLVVINGICHILVVILLGHVARVDRPYDTYAFNYRA